MGNWDDYKREESDYEALKPGKYRCVIATAEEKKSSAGNPMIVVGIKPNGSDIIIRDYFVKNQYFNQNITKFFDAFPDIGEGNFDFLSWVGAMGAVKLKPDGDYLKVHFYIKPDEAADLPEWMGKVPERQTVSNFEEVNLDDNDLPFC